jgi:hypothetical protein
LREYKSLFFIILALFAILFLGAYYSPTFEQQQTYLEMFVMLGALLFIFSLLVVFATISFGSFTIYLAIFLAIVMQLYGIEGALLVVGMSYVAWGGIFGMEFLLLHFEVKSAIGWFEARYSKKAFMIEYKVFYPMIIINLILLEWIPAILYQENFIKLHPRELASKMSQLLD